MNPLTESQLHVAFTNRWAGRPWAGLCQAVLRNASEFTGGFKKGYLTAKAAMAESGWLNPDPTTAPAGASHWYDIPHPDEHVALDLAGGGRRLLQALGVADEWWGDGLGVMSFDRLAEERPKWGYLGWSSHNGQNAIHLNTTSAAGGGRTPFDQEEDDMSTVQYVMITDDTAKDLGSVAGDWWCRPTPSASLEYLTPGQAHDALFAEKLESGPFAIAPQRVTARRGEWLRAALNEDRISNEITRRAHGLPAAGGQFGDFSDEDLLALADATSQRTRELLAGDIAGVPEEVIDELLARLLQPSAA